jgi:hypothetical protein
MLQTANPLLSENKQQSVFHAEAPAFNMIVMATVTSVAAYTP